MKNIVKEIRSNVLNENIDENSDENRQSLTRTEINEIFEEENIEDNSEIFKNFISNETISQLECEYEDESKCSIDECLIFSKEIENNSKFFQFSNLLTIE